MCLVWGFFWCFFSFFDNLFGPRVTQNSAHLEKLTDVIPKLPIFPYILHCTVFISNLPQTSLSFEFVSRAQSNTAASFNILPRQACCPWASAGNLLLFEGGRFIHIFYFPLLCRKKQPRCSVQFHRTLTKRMHQCKDQVLKSSASIAAQWAIASSCCSSCDNRAPHYSTVN